MKRVLAIGLLLLVVIATSWYWYQSTSTVDFNTQVKPILNKRCISCHGGVKREAEYSLLFPDEALAAGESGKPAIVPGNASASELIRRIKAHDPEERMPYKKDPLSEDEIQILTDWIDAGAQWGRHWAYTTIARQNVPTENSWSNNEIDRFTFDKMREHGLKPSTEASREVLNRRLSLDLVGLPANNPTSASYEAMVDSLLMSPRFGEKWASMWLDLARYSDTKGYERDYIRSIWRYRDWVIDALNSDKPYDTFLIEQLAGDLLPRPTDNQYIATAFHRNTMTNDEGGTDNEEFRTAAVVDRVNTTWESLMGTTFACTQCHSHPYDPFRQQDYYKFMAFFNNTRDEDTYDDYPLLRHYAPEDEDKVANLTTWVSQNISKQKADEVYLFLKTLQPTVNSIQADQFVQAALTDTKWLIFRNHGSARLPAIDLTGRNKLIFRYAAYRPGGLLNVKVGSPDGPTLFSWKAPDTKGDWRITEVSISPVDARHDLFFSYENVNLRMPNESGLKFDWFYFTDDQIKWGDLEKSFRALIEKEVDGTPVMVENPAYMSRVTRVFDRGNWLAKKDTVQPDVPASLSPFPKDAPRNRLGLAMWMTSSDNTLVARTVVNRIWEQLFGTGLAETLEDIGTQGIPPTHQELLDQLSWKLIHEYKWKLKPLIKEIVMSATYRQSSTVTAEHLAKDPTNRYLARASRVRLSGEQIRDQALYVSGLLSTKMYGPGVMPYQPEGIWLSPYNGESWKRSSGEDQYRRAVYTYWKRTAPYPSMITFDGSAREVCAARRIRTNTPLQALVTLNDSVYVEAAAHLARKMTSTPGTLRDQISKGYNLALGHAPTEPELTVLTNLYDRIATGHSVRPAKQNQTGDQQGDVAMTMVANAIMNLDEFLTRN